MIMTRLPTHERSVAEITARRPATGTAEADTRRPNVNPCRLSQFEIRSVRMLLNNRTRDKRKSQFLAGMTAPTFGDGEGMGRKSGPRSLRTESGLDLIEPRAKPTSI